MSSVLRQVVKPKPVIRKTAYCLFGFRVAAIAYNDKFPVVKIGGEYASDRERDDLRTIVSGNNY